MVLTTSNHDSFFFTRRCAAGTVGPAPLELGAISLWSPAPAAGMSGFVIAMSQGSQESGYVKVREHSSATAIGNVLSLRRFRHSGDDYYGMGKRIIIGNCHIYLSGRASRHDLGETTGRTA